MVVQRSPKPLAWVRFPWLLPTKITTYYGGDFRLNTEARTTGDESARFVLRRCVSLSHGVRELMLSDPQHGE